MKELLRNGYEKFRFYSTGHPALMLIVTFAILIAAVCIIVVSCNARRSAEHVAGSGLLLNDAYWKELEYGFKYYDKNGYRSQFGIDISEWVQDVDFRELKKAGVDFVILRVGYRGYETGSFVLDSRLKEYLKNASRAGLKMGAYFVSQAVNEEEAIEEAQLVLEQVMGYSMEMPLYIDMEAVTEAARTDSLTVNARTKIVQAFCDEIERSGCRAGVYANEAWFTEKMDYEKLKKYDIWLAKYTDTLSTDLSINVWQYSSQGQLPGAELFVDLNTRVTLDSQETGK